MSNTSPQGHFRYRCAGLPGPWQAALRDVSSLAASIALKEEFNGDGAIVSYLRNKGDNHEIHHNRTGNCIHCPEHVRTCARRARRRNARWKFRLSSLRKPCRHRPYCKQTQECYGEHARSDRPRSKRINRKWVSYEPHWRLE